MALCKFCKSCEDDRDPCLATKVIATEYLINKVFCVREHGHKGMHVACGVFTHKLATWRK